MALNCLKLTTQELVSDGWMVERTEHYNAFAQRSKDLLGFIDAIALRPGCILGVQATAASCHSKRVNKILNSPKAKIWLEAGTTALGVWGWRHDKKNKRMVRLVTHIMLRDGELVAERVV